MTITTRRGMSSDVTAAASLHDASGTELQLDPALERGRLDADEVLYLADVDGESAGYLLGTLSGGWAEHLRLAEHPMPQPFLYAVVVLPRYLRRGVATRLLAAFVDDARAAGRTAMAALPFDGSDSAAPWHSAVGFRLAEDDGREQAVHAALDELHLPAGPSQRASA